MKKKAIQTLIYLNSQKTSKFDSNNIHQTFNRLPKLNQVDIKHNAQRYATIQLQTNYGINTSAQMTKQEIKTTQQILKKINQIKRNKSIRLAGFIQRIAQKMNYQQLEEARQFLQALDRKQVKQLSFTLDTLHKVVNEKLQRIEQFSQNHTIASARSLIEELKKTRKIDEL